MLKKVETDRSLALASGARNLLLNCAGCVPGQSVLLVYETENDGYYDPTLAGEIARVATEIGLLVELYGVAFEQRVCDPDEALATRMAKADCTIFLARLGDQIRFREKYASMSQIICYALDCDMLASPFGTASYAGFEALKYLIHDNLERATIIHVTCPAGTDFVGRPAALHGPGCDVTRKRFPAAIFAPMPAAGFSGRIAQRGFLTGTGSNYYSPWNCEITETLMVEFDDNRITGFRGSLRDVAAARAHYETVGHTLSLDTYFVHSWHAGIHPGCAYNQPAGQHMERWNGSAFGNPRILHFHTCGRVPPGEISLNVLDPTVRIDGIAIWDNGILLPERLEGGAALLDAYPDMAEAFRTPARNVGQADCGNLRL